MNITILTLFPAVFQPVFDSSIFGRARQKKLINLQIIDIRNFATDPHKSVDDKPYGGGAGMLMKVDVLHKAILSVSLKHKKKYLREKIVLLDPKGKQFSQPLAQKFSLLDHLMLVCGHYEGFDERIYNFIDESVSIGRYILTGGEIPAMVVCDAVGRLVNGVLKKDSLLNESFSSKNLIEAPQYTRPPIYKKFKVPAILLSGNHLEISTWRKSHSVKSVK